jgi:hypothetical protein
MEYRVDKSVIQSFQKEAVKRGYDREQTKEYVEERKNAYKNSAVKSDVITLAAVAGTLGNIAINKSKGTSLKRAAIVQFKPLLKVIEEFLSKPIPKSSDNFVKPIANYISDSVNLAFKSLKGVYLSVPKVVRIPAVVLIGLNSLNYIMESNKVDAKHDTVKYLKDKQTINEQ